MMKFCIPSSPVIPLYAISDGHFDLQLDVEA